MLEGFDADFLASLLLIAHINMRRRVIADQHHRQPRRHVPAPFQAFNIFLDSLLNFFGDGFAVNDSQP